MIIQQSDEALRKARLLVANWPSALRKVEPLKIRAANSPAFDQPNTAEGWIQTMEAALSGVRPGGMVIADGYSVDRAYDAVRLVVRAWEREQALPKVGEVAWCLGFWLSPGEAPDLRFLWERAWASSGGNAMALMVSSWSEGQREVEVSAPLKGLNAGLVRFLPELPVVSAEIFQSLLGDEHEDSAYRWSNRVAALRRVGLLIPLDAYVQDRREVRVAHAKALGRDLDRRPTRLYRSALYDFSRWDSGRGGISGLRSAGQ